MVKNMNKTKIVATVGPASNSKEMMKKLILNGTDVFRVNLTYATYEFCLDVSKKLQELNKELKTEVALLLDTNGPSLNVGRINSGITKLTEKDKIRVYVDDILGDETKFSVNYPKLIHLVKYGSKMIINSGKVILKIIDKDLNYLLCEVERGGYISEKDGINIPGINLEIPFLNRKDRDDILFADKIGADFLALSYVKCAEDILKVNDLLIEIGNDHLNLLAKIEKIESLKEIDDIIRVSDGIVVARGDLANEIPMEKVPSVQKTIIHKCHKAGKVSLVSAEFMTSMETSMNPTRAEVSDVANAVIDSIDAIILTGETTIGKFPVETVNMMDKIIASAEQDINYSELLDRSMQTETEDVTGSLVYSVTECAKRLHAKAIMTPTMSGYTARKMSRFRPNCPVFALSPDRKTVRSLSLYFAIKPVYVEEIKTIDKAIEVSKEIANDYLEVKDGDKIIITGGYPFKKVKHTNFMKIEEL